MQTPSKPVDERRRLSAVRKLDILDTEPEERFDRFTRLARTLFDVPIAYVSIVDADRQWFKSRAGLPRDLVETTRDVSFCGHAILGDEMMEVPDATEDQRFYDNPQVIHEPNVRFYAGFPLTSSNGSKIGTFCLVDVKPRKLDHDESELLQSLAEMVGQEVVAEHTETIDRSTQISNRRGVIVLGGFLINVCHRLKLQATLLVFRLDGLEKIDSSFKHVIIEQALLRFSWFLRGTFRDLDIVGRTGPDTFAVLLSDLTPVQSTYALARLESSISAHNSAEPERYQLAFTVGAIHYDMTQSIEDMLQAGEAYLQTTQAA